MFRDNRQDKPKRRVIIQVTYEMLATWADLKPGSILNICPNPSCEILAITTDDPAYSFDIAEGQTIPVNPLKK